MSTMLERLAARLTQRADESDCQRTGLHLRDWLACVAGARTDAVADAARRLHDPLSAAALLGNRLEMDDVHRLGRLHPGPVVWPAVLMVADTADAMREGALAGYEAMIAVGETLDARHYASCHPTATAGIVGAAAAAGRVLGLDAERMADALGHATSLAGGLWNMRHSANATKAVHVLHAAEAGVRCARLAAAGLTGARGSLDGPQGLHEASCDAPGPLILGPRWRIHEVSFKPWAACRHAHPAIDAALGLGVAEGEIVVETYRDALLFCDRPNPRDAAEARFSIQHAVAAALVHGDPGPDLFEAEAIAALAEVRARVRVVESEEYTARYPAHFGARIVANDREVVRLDTLGDPERPLSEAQHHAKLATLCRWGGLDDDAPASVEAAIDSGPAAVRALLGTWLG